MNALRAGDFADLFAGRRIDDHDASGAGDEETMSGAVDGKVIPAAFAAELPGFYDLVVSGGCERGGEQETDAQEFSGSHREMLIESWDFGMKVGN